MPDEKKLPPIQVEAQPVGLFETPLAYCRLKDSEGLLSDLENSIREKKKQDEGVKRSNIGGWHSTTDMMEWGGESARRLAESAVTVARRLSHFKESSADNYNWLVRMWANVTPPGGLNHLHSHPGNLWAAVLYIDMGNDQEEGAESVGGRFYLEDPRFPMAAMKDTAFRMVGTDGSPQQYEVELKLERGSLVVFPAWLRHGVRVYTGQRERISIAMNIDAQPRR